MSETYSVVMTGQLADGQALEQVKANVAKLFKLGDGQLNKLFCGKPVAVRKGIDREKADRICAALLKAGAVAKVKSVAPKAAPAAAEQKPAQPAAEPVAVEKKESVGSFTPDLVCPRCGHEQAFTKACGLCKMDLTLHIKRLQRKEQARAFRRQLAQASGE